MARCTFGGGSADFVMSAASGGFIRLTSATLYVWPTASSGTRITDLLLADGTSATTIPVGNDGQVPVFSGPNDGTSEVWVSAGLTGTRVRLTSGVSSATDAVVSGLVANPASATGTVLQTAVDDAVTTAVASHTPGIELDSATRTSNFTTTNTSSSNSAGDIPSFSITITGTGRPVDVRFYSYAAYHSVANTGVAAVICVNGSPTSTNSQIGSVLSQSTSTGPSLSINHRTGVLTSGTSYTFTIRIWGLAAGTCALLGASFAPIELTVTSR